MPVYPSLPPALFGIGELRDDVPRENSTEADLDIAAIRRAVVPAVPSRNRSNRAT